ncbi:hypothetical protein ACH5RR_013250 [Cinchona calisaya]|uniref:Protein SDA1 n=1 Tax=Cinchona calisaya TaxID=153742 RepID=A0ABD3A001_9GENT
MTSTAASILPDKNLEAIITSRKDAEKMSLPSIQSKMKTNPEGYEIELQLIYNQFKSSVELFHQQAKMSITSVSGISANPNVAKDLGDRAMWKGKG